MVFNITETKLCTIEKIEQFMAASSDVEFRAHGNDLECYAHNSRVLKRFEYPERRVAHAQYRGMILIQSNWDGRTLTETTPETNTEPNLSAIQRRDGAEIAYSGERDR